MAAEDDTFDIDIYGDNEAPDPGLQDNGHEGGDGVEQNVNGAGYGYDGAEDEIDFEDEPERNVALPGRDEAEADAVKLRQGVKRKYRDDDHQEDSRQDNQVIDQSSLQDDDQGNHQDHHQDNHQDIQQDDNYQDGHLHTDQEDTAITSSAPLDPSATPALKLSNLDWYTTEEDLRHICATTNAEHDLLDLSFNEYKANGKSRGEAYLEFRSASVATKVKREIEAPTSSQKNPSESTTGVKKPAYTVFFTALGNPYRNMPTTGGAIGGKRDFNQGYKENGRGGAYNQNYTARGNYGRGGGYNANRGSYNNANNNAYNYSNSRPNQNQWGSGGYGNANAGYANPMLGMAGMGMGRGGNPMMGMMGGGGGFGGMGNMGMNMGMGNMGAMGMNAMNAMRGGMMGMMGRGGWGSGGGGGGFQGGMNQGFSNAAAFPQGSMSPQPQGQGQQQQQGNKRSKLE